MGTDELFKATVAGQFTSKNYYVAAANLTHAISKVTDEMKRDMEGNSLNLVIRSIEQVTGDKFHAKLVD